MLKSDIFTWSDFFRHGKCLHREQQRLGFARMSYLINFSTLSELYCVAPFRSFSVKYVCRGTEKYHVNGNKYTVEDGQYLLANHFSEGFVEIDNTVRGICIDVAPDVLSEVVASYRRPDTFIADPGLDTFLIPLIFLKTNSAEAIPIQADGCIHSTFRCFIEDSLAIRFSRSFILRLPNICSPIIFRSTKSCSRSKA